MQSRLQDLNALVKALGNMCFMVNFEVKNPSLLLQLQKDTALDRLQMLIGTQSCTEEMTETNSLRSSLRDGKGA